MGLEGFVSEAHGGVRPRLSSFNHRKGDGRESITRRRIRNRDHTWQGWPHYSARHLCMCLAECCQDEILGCMCRTCPCRTNPEIHGGT